MSCSYDCALDDALESGGGARLLAGVYHESGELVLQVAFQLPAQQFEVDAAGAHDGGCVHVVDQRQKQMLERGVFVTVVVGDGQPCAGHAPASGRNLA